MNVKNLGDYLSPTRERPQNVLFSVGFMAPHKREYLWHEKSSEQKKNR